jgi:UDPglucose 6-dehydrogenase
MKIGIIGTGYVGLVTGVMLSRKGHNIKSIDLNPKIVEKLQSGICTIHESGLEKHLGDSLKESKISFSSDYKDLVCSDAIFICVGTPGNEDGSANLGYVYSAISSVIEICDESTLIIIKSTVPPTSAVKFQEFIRQKGKKHLVTSSPEFLREGSAVFDFENPDRIVCGITDEYQKEIFNKIYYYIDIKKTPIIFTDTTTSEMIKYSSNSFLSVKLSFINEMANLCEKIGANIDDLSKGMGMDKRIGSLFLNAGPGYGGSCFPKDTNALEYLASKNEIETLVLSSSIKSNLSRYSMMRDKIMSFVLSGSTITALGMAFKAGTDDVRDSPAVNIIKLLVQENFMVQCCDVAGNQNFAGLNLPNCTVHDNPYEAMHQSECIVIFTEWDEFKNLDYKKASSIVKNKLIIDLRNLLDYEKVTEAGFKIVNIGKNLNK